MSAKAESETSLYQINKLSIKVAYLIKLYQLKLYQFLLHQNTIEMIHIHESRAYINIRKYLLTNPFSMQKICLLEFFESFSCPDNFFRAGSEFTKLPRPGSEF